MDAHPVEVVGLDEKDNKFRLNINNLRDILLQDDIKHREIVAVSIAGAFRKGKSFLLNFFLRYLSQKVNFSK